MIRVGLAPFKGHNKLTDRKNNTLYEYAGSLPLVELDTAYYGTPRKSSVESWVSEVPESLRFVVKVYQGISGQGGWEPYYQTEEEMIAYFLDVMSSMVNAGKMLYFLVQSPSPFRCAKENVQYLRKLREWPGGYPVPIGSRGYSWYSDEFPERTGNFMSRAAFFLATIDEPQLLNTTIPLDPSITNPNFASFRFHSRNVQGWQTNDKEWRKKGTLYRYSEKEPQELAHEVKITDSKTEEVGVIFNNNSGGDVAEDTLTL